MSPSQQRSATGKRMQHFGSIFLCFFFSAHECIFLCFELDVVLFWRTTTSMSCDFCGSFWLPLSFPVPSHTPDYPECLHSVVALRSAELAFTRGEREGGNEDKAEIMSVCVRVVGCVRLHLMFVCAGKGELGEEKKNLPDLLTEQFFFFFYLCQQRKKNKKQKQLARICPCPKTRTTQLENKNW